MIGADAAVLLPRKQDLNREFLPFFQRLTRMLMLTEGALLTPQTR